MIDLPRSTFCYRTTAKTAKLSDTELVAFIEDIQDELPCYGYRRGASPTNFADAGTSSTKSASLV